ncbi:MAG: hypothetical protein QXQ02_07600 [Halobacteria archaeon]
MAEEKCNCCAQISLDFITGIIIFSLAFLFLFQSITGLFIPFQTESEDVHFLANRVAAFLVEDPRALALNSQNPGLISLEKAIELNTSLSNSYETKINELGLVTPTRKYDLYIELRFLNDSVYRESSQAVLQAGKVPLDLSTVAQAKRVVLVSELKERLILSVKIW